MGYAVVCVLLGCLVLRNELHTDYVNHMGLKGDNHHVCNTVW